MKPMPALLSYPGNEAAHVAPTRAVAALSWGRGFVVDGITIG